MKNLVGKLQDLYGENDRSFGRNNIKTKKGNFRMTEDDFTPYKKKGRYNKFAK